MGRRVVGFGYRSTKRRVVMILLEIRRIRLHFLKWRNRQSYKLLVMKSRARRKFRRFISTLRQKSSLVSPIWPAFWTSIILSASLLAVLDQYETFGEIWRGLYIAAWGTAMSTFLVGVVVTWFAASREIKLQIERYIDEIEDNKKLDTEEAKSRIAGSLRRLARLGKTDVDLSGIILKSFSFSYQGIRSLKSAVFCHGWHFVGHKNATILEDVDFSFVDCNNVIFSRSTFDSTLEGLIGKNLSFIDASLREACFDGANLEWTSCKAKEDDWYIDHGFDDDGRPLLEQIYYPAFFGADLSGCSFRFANIRFGDFRGSENILEADFHNAQGLETCFFDEGILGKIIAQLKHSVD